MSKWTKKAKMSKTYGAGQVELNSYEVQNNEIASLEFDKARVRNL